MQSTRIEDGDAFAELLQEATTTSNNEYITSTLDIPGKITVVFGDITISSNFDSGNLARAEECRLIEGPDMHEFNLWVSPDCAETEFQNGNRTWFYFSVCTPQNFSGKTLKFNILNLNRQSKLYQQGLTPIIKIVPGRGSWERLRSRIDYESVEGVGMKISFQITIHDSRKLTTYFAFCYPYSYSECQRRLAKLDGQYGGRKFPISDDLDPNKIYYHRELLCHSLEGRRVDLITLTSWEGVTEEREWRLPNLFPDTATERCHIFKNKKVIFVSSRVHPGETPSSHVFNGLLHFLLRSNDERAIVLRKKFVFKLVPMLNPDGVYKGHYRTDTRGANLNRYYLNPDPDLQPSIYAARCLIMHYHQRSMGEMTVESDHDSADFNKSTCSIKAKDSKVICSSPCEATAIKTSLNVSSDGSSNLLTKQHVSSPSLGNGSCSPNGSIEVSQRSGIALYVDLHAHATKRGIFMYGNYFSNIHEQAENMLFPRLLSLNSPHLDFEHCVFSEKNMYVADKKDGLSKEGCGRVAIHKATGIIPSYTLECNYNSGRQCNALTEAPMCDGRASPPLPPSIMGHRFGISDFEQVGRALAISVLDLHQINPWTRLPTTTYGCLAALRQSLIQRLHISRAKKMSHNAQEIATMEFISDDERIKSGLGTNAHRALGSIMSSTHHLSKQKLSGTTYRATVGKVAGLGRFVDQQCIDTNPVNGNVTTLRTKSALRRTGLGQDKVFNIQASKAAPSVVFRSTHPRKKHKNTITPNSKWLDLQDDCTSNQTESGIDTSNSDNGRSVEMSSHTNSAINMRKLTASSHHMFEQDLRRSYKNLFSSHTHPHQIHLIPSFPHCKHSSFSTFPGRENVHGRGGRVLGNGKLKSLIQEATFLPDIVRSEVQHHQNDPVVTSRTVTPVVTAYTTTHKFKSSSQPAHIQLQLNIKTLTSKSHDSNRPIH